MMRDTRTQHRPPSRQVNDHGRVSGTHRARWDACARARPRQPVHRRLRRDLQNRTHQDPQDTCTHPRGERVRRTLNRHPSTRAPRPHRHLEPTATQKARRRLHRSLQHAPAPPFTRPATTRRHRPPRPARQTPPSRENGPLRRTHQRVPKCRLTSHDTVFGTHRLGRNGTSCCATASNATGLVDARASSISGVARPLRPTAACTILLESDASPANASRGVLGLRAATARTTSLSSRASARSEAAGVARLWAAAMRTSSLG